MNKKPFKVGEKYRKNVLSTIPGGSTVIVEYEDGSLREYTDIKNPAAYVQIIKKDPNVTDYWIKEE